MQALTSSVLYARFTWFSSSQKVLFAWHFVFCLIVNSKATAANTLNIYYYYPDGRTAQAQLTLVLSIVAVPQTAILEMKLPEP